MKKLKFSQYAFLYVLLVFLGTQLTVQAQESNKAEWKLIKEKTKNAGWSLYKRKVADSKIFEFKITGKVNSSIEMAQKAALDLVINPEHYKSKRGKEYGTFEILEQSEKEYTIYSLMYGPFVFKDRDVVLQYELYGDVSGNEAGLRWHNVDKAGYETKEKVIRMPQDIGDWNFKKIDENTCMATNVLRFHPGGKMPAWMINMMVKSRLPEELENLRSVSKTIE